MAAGARRSASVRRLDRTSLVLGAFAVLLVVLGAVNYARTDAEKRAFRDQFEHFLAPEVIAEIARDPAKHLTPSGEEREVSILFCDIRGFSTITEAMPSQDVIRFVNRFLTPISEVILEHGGTIDKYMGDVIMAFWNAPRQTPGYRIQFGPASLCFRLRHRGIGFGFPSSSGQRKMADDRQTQAHGSAARGRPGAVLGPGRHRPFTWTYYARTE